MKIRPQIVEMIATAGYIGRLPLSPGTFGSAIGLLIYFIMPTLPQPFILLGLIGFVIFSIRIAGEAEKLFAAKDPRCIVIDEVAGMLVTFFALPRTVFIGIAGFAVFRLLDILKPFPIKYAERKCPGGIGVVMDDVIAGLMSNVLVRIFLMIMNASK
jgi:phosphatidylglycerophosphatase A